jgi:hypothetical protein
MGSVTGSNYGIEVLQSGYAFTALAPTDYFNENQVVVQRYNIKGEYEGIHYKQLTGFGDAADLPAATNFNLGYLGQNLESDGAAAASSTLSNVTGSNSQWLVDFGQAAPTQTPLDQLQNPDQKRIYVIGDNNHPYEVQVNATSSSGILSGALAALEIAEYRTELLYQVDTSGNPLVPAVFVPDYSEVCIASGITNTISRVERVNGASNYVLSVNSSGGVNAAYVKSGGSGYDFPPLYLYSDLTSYYQVNPVSMLGQWLNESQYNQANPGLNLAVLDGGSQLSFNGGAALPAGNYKVQLDISNFGLADTAFKGFNLEVSLGPSTIETVTALPTGDGLFQLSYSDEVAGALTERITNLLPFNLSPVTDTDAGQNMQSQLQGSLSLMCGNLTVLTTGAYASQQGGPYYIQFPLSSNPIRLLKATATVGWSVQVTRVVQGTPSINEIQMVTLVRPLVDVEFQLPTGAPAGWIFNIYWSNSVDNSEVAPRARRLCLHGLQVLQETETAFSLDISSGSVVLTPLSVTNKTASSPGGWEINIAEDGTRTYAHESVEYATSSVPNNIVDNSEFPEGNLLTGSSIERLNSVVVTNPTLPADTSRLPTAPTVSGVVVV